MDPGFKHWLAIVAMMSRKGQAAGDEGRTTSPRAPYGAFCRKLQGIATTWQAFEVAVFDGAVWKRTGRPMQTAVRMDMPYVTF